MLLWVGAVRSLGGDIRTAEIDVFIFYEDFDQDRRVRKGHKPWFEPFCALNSRFPPPIKMSFFL